MRFIYKSTGTEVKVGDNLDIGRDGEVEAVRVTFFREPHKPDSSGKVCVNDGHGDAEYYVGVIGAEWIEREDQ